MGLETRPSVFPPFVPSVDQPFQLRAHVLIARIGVEALDADFQGAQRGPRKPGLMQADKFVDG